MPAYPWSGRHRRGKYAAKPTVVDNIRFASKKEANRYSELKLLERAGAIRGLQLQVKYPLKVAGFLVCCFISDFNYNEFVNGQWVPVVEDVKGYRTREYQIKKKLLFALHGIQIREV